LAELNDCRDKCRPETNARAGPLTLYIVGGRAGGRMDGSGARTHRPTPFAHRGIHSAVRARAASPWILLYTRGGIIYKNDFPAFQLPSIRPIAVCLTFDQ